VKLSSDARGKRYDHAVFEALEAEGHATSVREVRIALKEGRIQVEGRTKKPGDRASGGEEVLLLDFVPRKEATVEAEPDLLSSAPIAFEDDRLLALNKPSGMPVAPLRAGEKGTLLAAAIAHSNAIASAGPPLEGGLCHRLDIETSGVVLFAKDEAMRDGVRADFGAHRIEKRYFALVADPEGALDDLGEKGRTIEGAILGAGERVRVVDPGLKDALDASTSVHLRERLRGAHRWVEAVTKTGRRHQIRAHLASIGAPIAGDRLYGGPIESYPHLLLHAHRLLLSDGRSIEASLPSELEDVLERLRR
jgi:23S rRNA pseudouridine1911/1915/1917 synthase